MVTSRVGSRSLESPSLGNLHNGFGEGREGHTCSALGEPKLTANATRLAPTLHKRVKIGHSGWPKKLNSGRDDSPAENRRLCWIFESHFWGGFWPPAFLRGFLVAATLHRVKSAFAFARSCERSKGRASVTTPTGHITRCSAGNGVTQ